MKRFLSYFLSFSLLSFGALAQTGGTIWRLNPATGTGAVPEYSVGGTWRKAAIIEGSNQFVPPVPSWTTMTTAVDGGSVNVNAYPKTSYFGDNILGIYSGFTRAVKVDSTSTIFATFAGSDYVMCAGTTTICVGTFGGGTLATDTGAGNGVWAGNFLVSNSPTIQPHNGTGFNFTSLFGVEIDVNIQKKGAVAPTGTAAGLYLNGIFEAQPVGNFYGILIDAASKPVNWQWGMFVADGSVSNSAVFVGTQAVGNNTASQNIGWSSRTAGGILQIGLQTYEVDQFHKFTGGLRSTLVNGSVEHKPATGPAVLSVSPDQAAQVATVNFLDAGTLKWQAYKDTDNSFNIFDWAQGVKALEITSAGHVTLGETGKTTALLGQALANTGTIAGSTPFIFSQTWDAGAVAFSGFEVGITDTASAAASYPFRVKVGGSDIFSVKKDGTVTATGIVVSDGVTTNSGTITASTPSTITQTWNGAGIFNAVEINITDTASHSASAFLVGKVGGVEKINLRKDGTIVGINVLAGQLYGGAAANSVLTLFSTSTAGTTDSIIFKTGSQVTRWTIPNAGHLLAGADNIYDIGASGATRPRTVYIGTGINVAGNAGLSVTKTVRASGGAADCTLIYTGGILTGGTC